MFCPQGSLNYLGQLRAEEISRQQIGGLPARPSDLAQQQWGMRAICVKPMKEHS